MIDVAKNREAEFSPVETLFVVLGYGCHLSPAVRRYLEHAASRIGAAPVETAQVVTTGGRTAHRTAPGVSEAGMMADHLVALGVRAPIMIEENARTTVENIRNVARIIRERRLSPRRVSIFGDGARKRKIQALARYFLPEGQAFEVEPFDLRRTFSHWLVQSTIAVPFDALVARTPWIERLSLAVVERRMRRS